mmetsp:Transcript_46888/g.94586  ORF Transcript_46888/g.94586 Transcript_46888/m.94586 type:complete len:82 (-) Transcript_46888:171-416(-)
MPQNLRLVMPEFMSAQDTVNFYQAFGSFDPSSWAPPKPAEAVTVTTAEEAVVVVNKRGLSRFWLGSPSGPTELGFDLSPAR